MCVTILAACDAIPTQSQTTEEPVQIQEVPPIINATGVVVPSQVATLSMSTSGIVEEFFVNSGDQVKEGDVLVRLKGKEDLQSAIKSVEYELASAQKTLDDLYKEAETAETIALQDITTLTRQVRDAQYKLDNFTIPQNQSQLETLEAINLMKERLDSARKDFEPFRYKSSSNATRKDLKEKLEEAQSDYDSAIRRMEYENELAIVEANLQKAKNDYAIWLNGPDPADIAVAEARLNDVEARLLSAEAKYDDLDLIAPFDGIVSDTFIRAGEWVVQGQPIILLADLNQLQIETTDLNEIDAARVEIGSPVIITFDALPDIVIEGTVVSIAVKSSEGTGVNYRVVINPTEIPEDLRWGMTAFVDIELE